MEVKNSTKNRMRRAVSNIGTEIGTNIARWRKVLGYTQEELSSMTGIARTNISRVEGGKHVQSLDTLRRIASALNLRPEQLYRSPRRFKGGSMETVERAIVEYNDGTVKILGSKPASKQELMDFLRTMLKHIDSFGEDWYKDIPDR